MEFLKTTHANFVNLTSYESATCKLLTKCLICIIIIIRMSYCCKNALNMLQKCRNFTMHIIISSSISICVIIITV